MNVQFCTVGTSAILKVRAKELCDGNLTDFFYLVTAIGRDQTLGFVDYDDEPMTPFEWISVVEAANKNPEATVCVFFGTAGDLKAMFKDLYPADWVEELSPDNQLGAFILQTEDGHNELPTPIT